MERLQDVTDCAGVECLVDELAVAVPRQRDDRHVAFAEDLPGRLDAAEAREPEVDQDQVGPMLAGVVDGLDAVAGVRQHVEPGVLEHEPQVGAHDRVVFDGEDPGW